MDVCMYMYVCIYVGIVCMYVCMHVYVCACVYRERWGVAMWKYIDTCSDLCIHITIYACTNMRSCIIQCNGVNLPATKKSKVFRLGVACWLLVGSRGWWCNKLLFGITTPCQQNPMSIKLTLNNLHKKNNNSSHSWNIIVFEKTNYNKAQSHIFIHYFWICASPN